MISLIFLPKEQGMDLDTWMIYTAAAVGLSLTPGPNGLLSLTCGIRFGVHRTVFAVCGGVIGFLLLIAASLAGMGALLAASETAFTIAKWLGAIYLVYLGIKTWRARPPEVGAAAPDGIENGAAPLKLFTQGFLVATTNPKAMIFFAAFLPQFMTPDAPWFIQFVIMGGTFAAIEFIYEILLASTAQRIAPWIGANGRWFNRIAGGTFIGIGSILATVNRT